MTEALSMHACTPKLTQLISGGTKIQTWMSLKSLFKLLRTLHSKQDLKLERDCRKGMFEKQDRCFSNLICLFSTSTHVLSYLQGSHRDPDIENRLTDTERAEGRRRSDELREQHWDIYVTMCDTIANEKLPYADSCWWMVESNTL